MMDLITMVFVLSRRTRNLKTICLFPVCTMSMAAYKRFKNHLFVSSLHDEYGGVQDI